MANLIVYSKDIFEKDAILLENWVQGNRYILTNWQLADIRGNYKLQIGSDNYQLLIEGKDLLKINGKIQLPTDTTNIPAQIKQEKELKEQVFEKFFDVAQSTKFNS